MLWSYKCICLSTVAGSCVGRRSGSWVVWEGAQVAGSCVGRRSGSWVVWEGAQVAGSCGKALR